MRRTDRPFWQRGRKTEREGLPKRRNLITAKKWLTKIILLASFFVCASTLQKRYVPYLLHRKRTDVLFSPRITTLLKQLSFLGGFNASNFPIFVDTNAQIGVFFFFPSYFTFMTTRPDSHFWHKSVRK